MSDNLKANRSDLEDSEARHLQYNFAVALLVIVCAAIAFPRNGSN